MPMRRSNTMAKPKIRVIYSDERLITPSGLNIVNGMLVFLRAIALCMLCLMAGGFGNSRAGGQSTGTGSDPRATWT